MNISKGFASIAALVIVAFLSILGAAAISDRMNAIDQKTATISSDLDALRDQMNAQLNVTNNVPLAGSINAVGGLQYYLYGSGVGASDTTVTLTYFYIPVSKQKLQMSDFGTIGYLTLEPGNTTKQEFVSFTGITQNADGTATLTGLSRGLSPITPYTASSTLQKAHAGGTSAVVSNPPQLYNLFANKNNAESINPCGSTCGPWTFASTSPPRYDQVGAQHTGSYIATTSEFASVDYVNQTVLSGAANSSESVKGIVQLSTQLQMASSTTLGSTGAGNVLQAKYATSSPYTTGLWVPISQNDGKLSQSFIRLSDSWTFTGALTAQATTTINAGLIASSTAPADAATINLDWGKANTFTTVLGGSRIITFSDLAVGQSIKFIACQDSTGSRTLTWPSSVRWQFGSAPTLTTTAGKCDVISFFIATSTTSVFGATSANF